MIVKTSDLEYVVHCKDCRHSDTYPDDEEYEYGFTLKCLGIRYGGVRPEWYCEHGELREENGTR